MNWPRITKGSPATANDGRTVVAEAATGARSARPWNQ